MHRYLTIANLKAGAERYEKSDGGCRGLRVVVFPSRHKSFIVRYRFSGVPKKLTLGPVLLSHNGEGEPAESPALDTPLSLAAARQLCTKALREAKAGRDPAAADGAAAKARDRVNSKAGNLTAAPGAAGPCATGQQATLSRHRCSGSRDGVTCAPPAGRAAPNPSRRRPL